MGFKPIRLLFGLGIFAAVLVFPLASVHALTPINSPCPSAWNTNLKFGMVSLDVQKLQQFLNSDASTQVAASGPGSGGMETMRFGALTMAAVAKFQEKYASDILTPNGLSAGTGYVGASTRAKLNALCTSAVMGASTSAAPQPAPANTLKVTRAAVQPEYNVAPANALYVPFTTVTFTAGAEDVTVSKIVIERVGAGGDASFYDIGFLDPDGVENVWGYLNNKHQVTLNWSFTIPAGTSQTYTIVGDMNSDLSNNTGEIPQLQLDSVVASAPVTGSFPIVGTARAINSSITIGSASAVLGADDPNGERSRYITDTNVKFSSIRITAGGQEDLLLTSVNWMQSGSMEPSDVANMHTIVNGVSYPSPTSDGRYYTAVMDPGIVIHKGDSVDVTLVGDLTGTGAGRTAEFDLNYGADVGLTGQLYGFGVNLLAGGNTATEGHSVFLTDTGDTDGLALNPFFSGSITDISAGAVTNIGKN